MVLLLLSSNTKHLHTRFCVASGYCFPSLDQVAFAVLGQAFYATLPFDFYRFDFSSLACKARTSSTIDNNCNSSRPKAYSNSACRMRTSILLQEITNYWNMVQFCKANSLLSIFNFCNFCSAAGFSASSMGGPVGRGNLLRHNCIRKFCITDSLSCKAERNSLDSLRFDRVVSVPHSEAPLRRLPVVAFCDIAISSVCLKGLFSALA
uniref:Uncharacterized protein n=1 Tax=Glossina palpalis gambiensis TaxID=67801 RepID=A0A1B0BI74_9MUSC